MERLSNTWFENHMVQEWIAAMPGVRAKLEHGAQVADVGCGRGRAVIRLAQEFPRSYYVGYDNFGPAIEKATVNTRAAGVAGRVRFEERDATEGLHERYDVITIFDVLHDSVSPL